MMQILQKTIAGLKCRLVGEIADDAPRRSLVVMCHGFGASGEDLVGFGPEILRLQPEMIGRVQFVFPEAPLSLDSIGMPGGRAWWMLDLEKLNRAIENGEIRNLRNDHPPELPDAREKMIELIGTLTDELRIPMSQVALSGFSQGSMLATDVSLRMPEPPGELAIMSGSLLSEDEWQNLAQNRGPMNVLQSHGHQDPILPFEAAEWLRDLLTEAGMDVEFIPFQGMHTIPPQVVGRLAERLSALCVSD